MINIIRSASFLLLLTLLVACGGGNNTTKGGRTDGPDTGDKNKVKTLRMATFGDSTANTSSVNHDVHLFKANLDSELNQSIDPRKYQVSFYYPAAYLVGNGGVSGETTTQMLVRDDAPASLSRKATEDIIALKPQLILFRVGSINDLQKVTEEDRESIVEAVYDRHIRLLEKFTLAKISILDAGIFGYNPSQVGGFENADETQIRLALTSLNARFKAYAENHDNVSFINPTGVVSDAAGHYLPNMTYDGVHLSLQGSLAVAKKEVETITALFGKSSPASFDKSGDNIYPLISETETEHDANLFDIWGGDLSNKRIKTVDGKKYQFADFKRSDLNGGSQGGGINIKLDSIANSLEQGKIYGISLDIILENSSTSGDIKISTRLDLKNDNGGNYRLTTFSNGIKEEFKNMTRVAGRIELPPLLLNSSINAESLFRIHLSKLPLNTTVSIGVTALNIVERPDIQ